MHNVIVKLRETILHDKTAISLLLNDGRIKVRDDETNEIYVVEVKAKTIDDGGYEKLKADLIRLKVVIDECYSFANEYPQYEESKKKRLYWHRINRPEYGVDNKEAFALARELGIKPIFRITSGIQRNSFPAKYAKTHYIIEEGSYNAG